MRTLAIGCGGAGANIVSGLDVPNKTIINTDGKSDVTLVPDNIKGTKGDNHIGMTLAEDNLDAIDGIIEGYDNLIIVAGLGGGTGTGIAPLVAGKASSAGIRTVVIVTIPMKFEGRDEKTYQALFELIGSADRIILLDLDIIVSSSKTDTFENALVYADDLMRETIQKVYKMLQGPFFSTFPENMYTISKAEGNTPEEKVRNALENPLYEIKEHHGKIVIQADEGMLRHRDRISEETCLITGTLPEIIPSKKEGMTFFIPVSLPN